MHLLNGYRCFFHGSKQRGRELNHSTPCSAEVKNEWICTSASPIRILGVDR
jgi:hypothetical protein